MHKKDLGADAAAVDGSMAASADTVAPHAAPMQNVLENYLQHLRSCASLKCANCGGGIDRHPIGVYCVRGFAENPCTCGFDAARACLRWQPIETAPKDGTLVLLWKPATNERFAAAYIQGGYGYGWCTPDGFEIFKATLWSPLLDPPQEVGSGNQSTEGYAPSTRRSAAP